MRKTIFALLIFSIFTIINHSCSKDEKSLDLYSSVESDTVETKIINFINRLDLVRDDPEYQGSDKWNYVQDSAVWYIEAALNYDYAYPNEPRSKLIEDSMYIELTKLSNGRINIIEIQNEFDLTLDTLTLGFNSIESESKFLLSVDYKVIGSNTNVVKMIVYFYFGVFSTTLPDGDWVIEGGEYGNGGLCGTTTYQNFDGTDKLEQEIFNANTIHQLNVGFTNIASNTPLGNYYSININFNYTPCEIEVMYDQIEWAPANFLTCLGINHMNIYEENMVNTMINYHQGTQRSFIVEDIQWHFLLVQPGIDPYRHMYWDFITTGNAYPRIYDPKNDYYE